MKQVQPGLGVGERSEDAPPETGDGRPFVERVRHPAAEDRRDAGPLQRGEAAGQQHGRGHDGQADPDHGQAEAEEEADHGEHHGDQTERETEQDVLSVEAELPQHAPGRGRGKVLAGRGRGVHVLDARHRRPPNRSRHPPSRG
jgi:hypothetical protein